MFTQYLVTVLASATIFCKADYFPSDDVVELTASNFNSKVIQSDDVWLIEFYAPWCGHCQRLEPEWKKAATALKGIVKVGAVNMDVHASVGGPYNVRGFPTIKMFGANKNSPQDYNGARSASNIANEAINLLRQTVEARLSGKGGSRQQSHSGGSGSGDPKDVIELNDNNFEKEVFSSKDLWLVEFFAPWCGHCKALAPEWAKAATELKGKVKLAAVDATVSTIIANKYGIRGYPTIKVFPAGAKDHNSAEDYDGGRTASDIIAWATEKAAASVPPPDVLELTSNDVLKAECQDKQLCVLSFLPHILDSMAEGRNKYIKLLKDIGEKYRKKMWGWGWAEAGAHPKLETALGIGGFGYPAMAVVNSRKKMFVLLTGPFEEGGINELLRAVAVGRGRTEPIKGDTLPTIESREPWDGKDGEIPQEEDYGDLDDLDMDSNEKSKDEL
ncbi:protein disulfide-isomerase A6-like [Rhopilema esculentum]|uniref:protein disulfide-isomerase A6-like n=1 Tax=Rhopilema esculentum TaxID=499914 RepID=UPI0031E393A3